jgi:hypothetical protein
MPAIIDLFYAACYNADQKICAKVSQLPNPTFTLAFILATLLGAAFHLIVGGDARRLALFLLTGWIGFAVGHFAGVVSGFGILNIGSLRLAPAVIGAVTALVLSYFLTSDRFRARSDRRRAPR